MADFLTIKARHAGQEIARSFHAGQEAAFAFGRGTTMFAKAPIELYGRTEARVVSDAGEKWFEFGFRVDAALTGNGATGWTDAGNYLRLEAQWTPDLVNWSMGKFVPAPTPVVDLGDGSFEYWSRALNPQDSAIKTGALVCSQSNGDVRNNPLTSLVIAGVAQALPHFPYDFDLAGTAAQLQADLIALGWTGATVTGTSRATWAISVPSVNYTSYAQYSSVGFPMYLIADVFGVVNTPFSSMPFVGSFVDAAGTAILTKAFARLKITAGTRYNPYR